MKFRLFLLITFFFFNNIFPCTTAIISGKATVDGRPLLWKHRDTSFEQNKIMFFNDGKYSYYGLVNSADEKGEEVWGGMNSAGFAIMNSASYNLQSFTDTTKIKDREGIIMKLALMQCSTLDEFEQLLKNLPKPLGVEANFGVIDAYGGAAYYETDNFSFIKFDVNDSEVAPNGYLIRTNFSFAGDEERGHGYIRYETAQKLFEDKLYDGKISHDFIFLEAGRSLYNSRTKTDLAIKKDYVKDENVFAYFRDFIPRSSSVSSIVVRGIKPGESINLYTMFTALGFPFTTVTYPVYFTGDDDFSFLLRADENGNAPICDISIKFKQICYPITKGSGKDYIALNHLFNKDNTGFLQLLQPLEKEIFKLEKDFFENIQNRKREISAFYSELDDLITAYYSKYFNVELKK